MSGSDKRVFRVTCRYSRLTYYFNALLSPLCFLFPLIYTLWIEVEPIGTMPIYVYIILGALKIPYLGMVIRCLRKDVPVPTYRLGEEGRMAFFLAVMIYMYCISYISPDIHRFEVALFGFSLMKEGISIVQLSCPAEDFLIIDNYVTMPLGVVLGLAGWLGTISWSDFFASLLSFPIVVILIELDHISEHCMSRDRFSLV